MLSMKSRAVSSPVTVLSHGTKCAILVSRSTTTKIESKPLEDGRSTIKSMEIEDHGFSGIGSGCNNPYGRCRGILEREQMSHVVTYSLTDFHICSHQKSRDMSSMVLLKPKCPAAGRSCRDWSTWSRHGPLGT